VVECGLKSLFIMANQYTFIGQYSYQIDSKNRINLPSDFRKQFKSSEKNTFVITQGLDQSLWIYPINEWKKIEKELSSLSSISKVNRSFLRNYLRNAKIIVFDKQGRFVLPENLLNFAKISKNVSIIGVLNRIEIWNPEVLKKVDNEKIDHLLFESLAEKVKI
jgi:MraZ protein